MTKRIFLVGNPNVGKSVVFSRITGVHVIASNYPGTTVEITKGYLTAEDGRMEVMDLPGIYSLEGSSRAEQVAVNVLRENRNSDAIIINVLDSTNLERNLYLTLQLIEEGYPLVVCLNMCDDTGHRGIHIDEKKLEEMLGVPVVSTCAVTAKGIRVLINRLAEAKPVETGRLAYEERWLKIGKIIENTQRLTHRHHTLREIMEDISVKPFPGIIIAIAAILLSFKIVRFIGEGLISRVSDPIFFNFYQPFLERISIFLRGNRFLHHLLIGELIDGKIDFKQSLGLLTTAPYIEFAMVLPYIVAFYFVLGILEDMGFLPRLAIILDNLFHRLGLHGFAIIPVLLGFGCNVPGILSTRVLESRRERFIASTLISIGVPCVPLQAMIFGLLGAFSGFYVAGVYFVLFSVWLILGIILNKSLNGYSPEFFIEIPPYRLPPVNVLLRKLLFRIKGFLFEALPIVMAGVLIINILLFFNLFDTVTEVSAPLITGLFGLPKEAVISLSVGFFRKDVAVGMLMPLGLTPKQLFISSVLLAMSFPCIATFVVMFKELGLRDLTKAFLIMVSASLIVGGLLNFLIIR